MNRAEKTKIAQGGWPYLLFIVGCFLLYICGIHIGQIAAIARPWPENMDALLWNAPFSGRVFRGAGTVIFLLFATVTLAGLQAFRSLTDLMDAARDRLQGLDRRHVAAVIGTSIFGLPLLIGASMFLPKLLIGIGFLVLGGALLINMGVAGYAVLAVAWVTAGSMLSEDMMRRSYDLHEDCRPGAQIMLRSSEPLACSSIQELGLYHGVLIRSETKSTFVPIDELDQQSVIEAVGRMGNLLF
ncbi:hypothetical protein GAO09_16935 [Rhizobiales bacterium RZME27]|uniref:Uncharacterized protein n=1 Tax=Endobacterium cereale TaxID=2663029 RepID=A0A6A8A8X6_9HYPH|nr:hypothetical protein [Endobacterium cereale]MQY47723.1 hypothetical protein [Endobacterium cereale]